MTETTPEKPKPSKAKKTAGKKPVSKKASANKAAPKKTAPKKMTGEKDAYLVLARKYRPSDFSDLIGQDAMVQTLRNAFASNRIAQSYMLSGVRGVGKTTTARILARALNYETETINEPTIDIVEPGLHCPAIMAGTHVDVMEMDAASHTGIDDIREIIEAARYKPVSARYKVYIIDEVHMLSKSAFNGLLKTLEEPPEHVKFIFATTELRKVPITVLSRCQRFDLRRIDIKSLEDHFTSIAEQEDVKIEPGAIALIARAAQGSVRDGLSLLDQAFARSSQTAISASDIRSMLGLADTAEILKLLSAIFKGEAPLAMEMFQSFYDQGGDPHQIISDMAQAVHAITRTKALDGAPDSQDQSESVQQEVAAMAGPLSHAVLHRAWQTLLKGYEEVGKAPNQFSAAEMIILRLTYMSDMPSPADLITALKNTKKKPQAENAQLAEHANQPPIQPSQDPQSEAKNQSQANHRPAHGGDRSERRSSLKRDQESAPDVFHETVSSPKANMSDRPSLASFADVVALIGEKRDVQLKLQVEGFAELVSFAHGRIELHVLEGANEGFVGDLSSKLTKWTGTRWMVALSHERGQATIGSQNREKEQKELDQIKAHPAVKETLKAFPGAQITGIKPIDPPEET